MSTFYKYLTGELSQGEVREYFFRNLFEKKLKERKSIEEKLSFILDTLDARDKIEITEHIIDALNDMMPLIHKNRAVLNILKEEDSDIVSATSSLLKRYRNTGELGVIAGLCALAIAAKLDLPNARSLISQAKAVAFASNPTGNK